MTASARRLDQSSNLVDRIWAIGVGVFLVLMLVFGGVSEQAPAQAFVLRTASIVVIALGLLRIRFEPPNRSAAQAFVIILLALALIAIQLMPLPASLWMSLPGRQFVAEGLIAAGHEPGWMPLSLSPPATISALLALLPPIAAFVAVLSLAPNDRWRMVFIVLTGVLLSILLGLGQKFQGPQSWLYFYEDASGDAATGTFANRNFFAALLYCAIPLTWALSLRLIREGRVSKYVVGVFGGIMLLVIILGLASAGSRAGIILAMVALLASATLGWGGQASDRRSSQSRWAIIAAAAALLVLGQFGMVAILRLAELDPVSDYRTQISEVSLRAAWAYFPFGSGFGTFVPVYAMHETPKTMLSSYVNHAHNDWLELWLEGGLPAALLLIGFLAWYAMGLFRLWRPSSEADHLLLQRAAAITCGLLLLHSIVDYPLREPALGGPIRPLLRVYDVFSRVSTETKVAPRF